MAVASPGAEEGGSLMETNVMQLWECVLFKAYIHE